MLLAVDIPKRKEEQKDFLRGLTCFCGRAKIWLSNLDYEGDIKQTQVDYLRSIFDDNGCERVHNPENHIAAIITISDLKEALNRTKEKSEADGEATTVSQADFMQDGEPRFLHLRPNVRLQIIYGRHRLKAGEAYLKAEDRWWVVTLYLDQLSTDTWQLIHKHTSDSLNFSDGFIYKNYRFYQSREDTTQANQWFERLSKKKQELVNQLNGPNLKAFREAFDQNLPFTAFWTRIQLGNFSSIFPQNFSEGYVSYLDRLFHDWSFILGDNKIFPLLDPRSLSYVEGLTPEAKNDRQWIAEHMTRRDEGTFTLFPWIDDEAIRDGIRDRIEHVKGRIPSLNNLYSDSLFAGDVVMFLKQLLHEKVKNNCSLRETFKLQFEPKESHPSAESSFYILFLEAMQNLPIFSGESSGRLNSGKSKLESDIKHKGSRSALAQVAFNLGFCGTGMNNALRKNDPLFEAATEFISGITSPSTGVFNKVRATELARHIALEIEEITVPGHKNKPEFYSNTKVEREARCGRPKFEDFVDFRADLTVSILHNYTTETGDHLTPLAFVRDFIFCFFKDNMLLPLGSCGNNPAHSNFPKKRNKRTVYGTNELLPVDDDEEPSMVVTELERMRYSAIYICEEKKYISFTSHEEQTDKGMKILLSHANRKTCFIKLEPHGISFVRLDKFSFTNSQIDIILVYPKGGMKDSETWTSRENFLRNINQRFPPTQNTSLSGGLCETSQLPSS